MVPHWWESKIGAAAVEDTVDIAQKVNTELAHNPASLFLGVHPPKLKTGLSYSNASSQRSIFKIANTWKQPKGLQSSEWIENVEYTKSGILFNHKRSEVLIHAAK